MLNKIINIVFQLGFLFILIILTLSSLKVISLNVKNIHTIKKGIILNSEYFDVDDGENLRGNYINTILLINKKDTVYGGTNNILELGDSVRIRYIGKAGNKIFEVNNYKIASKYDAWDVLSPVLLIFCLFLLFKVFIQPFF